MSWIFFEFFGILWFFLEFSKNCLEFFGIFKKMFGNFRNFQKVFGIFRNFQKIFGIFRNFQKIVWIFSEFSKKCLKMFWNFFATEQSPLPHDGAERPRRHSKKAPTSTFLGSKQRRKVARVATSGSEIDQNSEKRCFFWFSKISRFSSRAKRAPLRHPDETLSHLPIETPQQKCLQIKKS